MCVLWYTTKERREYTTNRKEKNERRKQEEKEEKRREEKRREKKREESKIVIGKTRTYLGTKITITLISKEGNNRNLKGQVPISTS